MKYSFWALVIGLVQLSLSTSAVRSLHPEHQSAPFGWELSSANWDAVALHLKDLIKTPKRNLRHIHFSTWVDSSQSELSEDDQLVNSLRMYPEHVASARKFFDILDTNNDHYLDLHEFLNAMDATEPSAPAAPPRVLRDAGQETFEAFSPGKYMPFKQFCRFLVIMSYDRSSDFKWRSEDLDALQTKHLEALKNHSKPALMRTFATFDEDSDGQLEKEEFEDVYMGKLYWTLRYKDKLPSGILDSDEEYKFAKNRFDRYTRGTGTLGFPEFVRLVENAAEHKPPNVKGGGEGCISCRIQAAVASQLRKSAVAHVSLLWTVRIFLILLPIVV